jgi:hypothetical protein
MDTMKIYLWVDLWEEAKKRWASEAEGWNNSRALKMMKELGIIWGWAIAKWADWIMRALANWRGGFFWTNKCDWHKTSQTWMFEYTPNWAWHFFAVLWYDVDEQVFYAKNSWGEAWWPFGWKFKIPFDQIWNLFTTYVVYDNKTSLIDNYKKKMREAINLEWAKKFFDRGYTNLERPTDKVTREEMWATCEAFLAANNLK